MRCTRCASTPARSMRVAAVCTLCRARHNVQRCGGALNLNVHFHCVIPDGVFVQEVGSVRFVELAPPSDDDLMAVLRRAVARLERLLRPRLMAAQADARPLDALGSAQTDAMHMLGTAPPDSGRAKRRAAYLQGSHCTRRSTCTRTTVKGWPTSAGTAPVLRSRRSGSPRCPTAGSPTGSSAGSATAARCPPGKTPLACAP